MSSGFMGGVPVLDRAQMKAAEAAADAAGTSYAQLMENAGAAAAGALEKLAPGRAEILLLCGSGNNAGDAFVMARLLAPKGYRVTWLDATEKGEGRYSPLAAQNRKKMPQAVRQVTVESAPWDAGFIVDAVFGTGFHGPFPKEVSRVFQKANGVAGIRVALDIPSGLDCDTGEALPDTFRARHTFTFGAYKPALLMAQCAAYVGTVRCLDLGL